MYLFIKLHLFSLSIHKLWNQIKFFFYFFKTHIQYVSKFCWPHMQKCILNLSTSLFSTATTSASNPITVHITCLFTSLQCSLLHLLDKQWPADLSKLYIKSCHLSEYIPDFDSYYLYMLQVHTPSFCLVFHLLKCLLNKRL